MSEMQRTEETIVALATPQGVGAIALIRLSGPDAIGLTNQVFHGKDLDQVATHTVHFGTIRDGNRILDEVLVSVFREPQSFTRENITEISCHGSPYLAQEIIKLLIRQGARPAKAGEFTQRAFLNGQFDLAQAEAIADVIAADSEAAHKAAVQQMRGGFSAEIKQLRDQLVHFASMVELELDFGEEDVEFADRHDLRQLIQQLQSVIQALLDSFDVGNVIKNGVPTVIAGKPNAGKSTLLNALLKEEKAIVSDIAGTTRDFIEDELILGGVSFRFIDTAGLRETTDTVEKLGVERTRAKMKEASLILYLFDLSTEPVSEIMREVNRLENQGIPFIAIGNKLDKAPEALRSTLEQRGDFALISAAEGDHLESLKELILAKTSLADFRTGDTLVTNVRHYDSLLRTRDSLSKVLEGLDLSVTGDFLAMDIRQALHYLGEITGEITTDDLLANIFSKFCIGK